MSWLDTLARAFVPQPMQEREISDLSNFEDQLAAIRRGQNQARPWRQASVNEALGVPAILSAVSLISGVAGSLSMEAFRSGALVTDQAQVPRLMQRPNPRSTAREFYLKTAFYHASRGEFWWWVAHRDTDGNADALFPVPPWEITVERNDRDRLNPTIRWLNRIMPNDDMRHQMYLPGPDGLRGVGPLQLAGAAVSVTVEASNWAANFYSGALPSIVGTTEQDLDAEDLKALDEQWSEKPANLPRWMTNGMTLGEAPFDAQKAQLTESRSFQVGEVARMFGIPGPLLEYQMSGSSLTYRNEEDIWSDFQRRCLSPQYLEPMEQEMSDLLPRTVVGRFNLDQLLRADIKTRFDVYGVGIDKGIFGADYAQRKEGIIPGNVDFAPVPFSPPAADPGPIPMQSRSLEPVHCVKCHALLAEFAGAPYRFTCRKCKSVTTAAEPLQVREAPVQAAPQPLTVAPSISFASPDLSVIEKLAAETKRGNDIHARTASAIEELLGRDQVIPQITVEAAAAPEVTVHTDSFVEAVADLKAMYAMPRKRQVIRNAEGRIVGVEDVA